MVSKLLQSFFDDLQLTARPIKRAVIAINNSGLGVLKNRLLCLAPFKGNESHFAIGSEVHKRVLEPKRKIKRFIKAEEILIRAMVSALLGNAVMQGLLKGSIKEKTLTGVVHGVPMHGTLDINHKRKKNLAADIKTTSAKSQADCIKSCIMYGYFRQALVYMALSKTKDFIFIFVQKTENPKIFFVNVKDYPAEMAYAEKELKFLLYFYANYGMPAGPPLIKI